MNLKRPAPQQRTSIACVAFLRGINVGGNNLIPMAELRKLFAAAGCADVSSYIQSGNVYFNASPTVLTGLSVSIGKQPQATFGFQVPVILRTARELEAAIAANPFIKSGTPPAELHLMFLSNAPAAADAARLDHTRSKTDAFALKQREIYLHCPDGLGRTKLTNTYFGGVLKTSSSVRNWRTVLKLSELLSMCQAP